MSGAEIAIFLAAIGAFIVAMIWRVSQLNDPSNTTVIRPEQLLQVSMLQPGRCSAQLFRQSGGLYRDLGEFDTAGEAIGAVLASLARAKVEAIYVMRNDSAQLHIRRMLRNGRGKNEGKTLGGAVISVTAPAPAESRSIVCGSCGFDVSERVPGDLSGEYGCAQCDNWASMDEVMRIARRHYDLGHPDGAQCGCRFQLGT